jgi:hypothetical protein
MFDCFEGVPVEHAAYGYLVQVPAQLCFAGSGDGMLPKGESPCIPQLCTCAVQPEPCMSVQQVQCTHV